jgi:glycosyltransferase involved in cell wall biosynthesis
MRPLRLLLLNSARRWIGEAAHTIALAEGLRDRGHSVVLCVRKGHEMESRARERNLRVESLAFSSRFSPAADLSDWRRIRALLRTERIDLVHCHRGKDHWIASLARAPSACAPPLVRTRHVVTPVGGHPFNRWLYGRATQGLICVSQAARRSLDSLAGALDPARTRIIASAVDSALFSSVRRSAEARLRLGARDDEPLIGLIARIQRVKGQRYFLRAAAEVARRHPQARFLVAGRGSPSQFAALREFAQSAGLPADRLVLAGVLADLPAVMASLDVAVIASVGSEGSSRVALEAMASAVPLVATRVGGIPELVAHERQGLLVPPRDPQALAEGIGRLIADPSLRSSMGAEGRKSVEERFNLSRWLDETEAFYGEVLSRSGAGSI